MEAYERAYWMEANPRQCKTSRARNGDGTGQSWCAVRDGGSVSRMGGGIACWNAMMDENKLTWCRSGMIRRGVEVPLRRAARLRLLDPLRGLGGRPRTAGASLARALVSVSASSKTTVER